MGARHYRPLLPLFLAFSNFRKANPSSQTPVPPSLGKWGTWGGIHWHGTPHLVVGRFKGECKGSISYYHHSIYLLLIIHLFYYIWGGGGVGTNPKKRAPRSPRAFDRRPPHARSRTRTRCRWASAGTSGGPRRVPTALPKMSWTLKISWTLKVMDP